MTWMSTRLLLSLAAIASPSSVAVPARAQHMNAADGPCSSYEGTDGNAGLTGCLIAAAKEADGELNEAYRRVTSVLDAAARQELQDAQRSWLSYRDQTCLAERNLYGGGTGGIAAQPACGEALTRHRIADLKGTYWWKVEKFGG